MDTIFQKITEWLKEMLVSGIMESLSGMFDSVNQQVSDVATQVGTSPVNFSPGVFAMIRNVSESVIIPIAGLILTFILSVLPAPLMDKYGDTVRNIRMDEQWQKEQFLNLSFSPENFDKYCRLVQDRIWIVFVNKFRNNMPFATSDNPVLIEGIGKKEIGLFSNGLTNPATCIFYPLSPAIAIASYSKQGIMGIAANDLDGKRILLDDLKYIMD